MTTWLTRCFAGLLLVLPFVPAVADDPDDKEIARLVKQLDSSDYRTRDAASKRLREIGEPALDALQKATINVDVESRRRAESIIAVVEGKLTHDSLKFCVEQRCLTGHKPNPRFNGPARGAVTTVSVSADGKRLLTSGFDTTLRLWDADTGKELRVFEGHSDAVTGAALSPDGTRILSACADNSVWLWDATTGKVLHKMAGHRTNFALSVAFGPEGQALSGGGDSAMYLWDLNTGKKAGVFICSTNRINLAAVSTVAYSAKAKLAVTAGEDQPIRLWNLETGKEALRIVAGLDRTTVCFSLDGKRLAACYDATVRIWDVEKGNELLRIDARLSPDGKYEAQAYCVALSPDGKRIVTGGSHEDKTVRVWDVKTGQELRKYEGHTQIVVCVTYFPDGKRIASTSQDGTVRIWVAPR